MTNSRLTRLQGDPAVDDALAVLADERRRTVLRRLQTADLPVAIADLVRDVVVSERGGDADEVPAEFVERVHLSLHHIHLPKLADRGYLRYDEERATVELTDDADSLVPILERLDQRSE